MSAAAEIRIGALAPLSPPGWVDAGRHLLAGLELGVATINDEGGIDGRPLSLLVRDTAADPRRAKAAVEEFAGLGVAAVVGEYHSVVARQAATTAESLGVPFLCSSAVLDQLTDEPAEWVARIAPPQSRGWRIYADFLLATGHRRIAVIAQESVYWAAGTRILGDHFSARGGSLVELGPAGLDPETVDDPVVATGATAVLLLTGYPQPAASIVGAIRGDARLADLFLGAPAGQPELAGWTEALGALGAGIPFLRYLPERFGPLGARVESSLCEALGEPPSFVAFEGYDTIAALAEALRLSGPDRAAIAASWPDIAVEGTRGEVRFAREPGISVWQSPAPPIQVAERDPQDPARLRVLHQA
jgi:ABC-type branched-subunit amino acid transport system substrate-binding protein